MDAAFWHQRWQDNLIGFHQADINPHLQSFWPRLGLNPGDAVFVPLCGKSRDMLWLGARHPVLGVELSPIAVEAFFAEAGLVPRHGQECGFSVCEADRLRLLCGDFFDLVPQQLEAVRGVYDRGALVALPPQLRGRYVERLNDLLPAATAMLLVTMEYPQAEMPGPPFAVEEAEVHRLFADRWSIEPVYEQDVLATEPRFRQRGLSRLNERIFVLRRSAG
jgi:thiopurine S-methyltransferase